jgi:hypothetical protein
MKPLPLGDPAVSKTMTFPRRFLVGRLPERPFWTTLKCLYDWVRRHSSLGLLSPSEYEQVTMK